MFIRVCRVPKVRLMNFVPTKARASPNWSLSFVNPRELDEMRIVTSIKMKNDSKFAWSSEIPYGMSEIENDAASRYSTASSDSLLHGDSLRCCIRNCKELLPIRHRGQAPSFCPEHGISMSPKPTYVYRDPERNFIIGKEIPARLDKVENWRLGSEASEDALSW